MPEAKKVYIAVIGRFNALCLRYRIYSSFFTKMTLFCYITKNLKNNLFSVDFVSYRSFEPVCERA